MTTTSGQVERSRSNRIGLRYDRLHDRSSPGNAPVETPMSISATASRGILEPVSDRGRRAGDDTHGKAQNPAGVIVVGILPLSSTATASNQPARVHKLTTYPASAGCEPCPNSEAPGKRAREYAAPIRQQATETCADSREALAGAREAERRA
jgi:hypothetical protein